MEPIATDLNGTTDCDANVSTPSSLQNLLSLSYHLPLYHIHQYTFWVDVIRVDFISSSFDV